MNIYLHKFVHHTNYEKYFFFSIAILQMVPYYMLGFIPSMDGPQHLHNTQVLIELAKSNAFIQSFYTLNPVLVGYWTQPFVMSMFNLFMPAIMAEKLMISVYLLGLAYAFRYLIKSLNPDAGFLTILIIPFSFTFFFQQGYYSFSIAFIFFFWALGYYIRNAGTLKVWLGLMVLMFMIFLSHSLVFVVFGLSMVIFILMEFITGFLKSGDLRSSLDLYVSKSVYVFSAALPAIVFFSLHYIHMRQVDSTLAQNSAGLSEMISNIIKIRPIIGFHAARESPGNYLYWIVILIAVAVRSFLTRDEMALRSSVSHPKNYLLILSLVFLTVYFLVPQSISAGDIDLRMLILVFYFLIAWVASLNIARKTTLVLALIVVIAFGHQMRFRYKNALELSMMANDIYALQQKIEPNTVVYPVRVSRNWIDTHFPLYLGVDKPVVHLGNPQVYGLLPIVWNQSNLPQLKVGDLDVSDSHGRHITPDRDVYQVDYVIIYRYNEYLVSDQEFEITPMLQQYYDLVEISPLGAAALYRKK
jgi:hypothetical protein